MPLPNLPTEVPAIPELPLPELPLPSLPTEVPAIPELPLPELPLPSLPTDIPDLSSGIPSEVLNVPIPDIDGINWADFESPPFSDLPAPSLDDLPIPADVMNIPVPEFDEFGVPIDSPLDAPDLPAALPSVLPDLLDWPFDDWEIPNSIAPDANGELPSLEDLPVPTDMLNVPVPNLDTLGVPFALPTDVVVPALLTDVGGILPLGLPTDAAPALPTEISEGILPPVSQRS